MQKFILSFFVTLAVYVPASAGNISVSLGNTTPAFNDGDFLALVADILPAQAGQLAPFNAGLGIKLFGPNGSAIFSFNFGAIVDPITSAFVRAGSASSITIPPHREASLTCSNSIPQT